MLSKLPSISFSQRKGPTRFGVAVTVGALLALLQLVILAASPHAHESVHEDADHPEHVCAVTLAAAGFCDTTPATCDAQPSLPPAGTPVASQTGEPWSLPDYWHLPAHAPPDGN